MPTVGKIGAWRIVIYPNDHRPAHVHVIDSVNRKEAVFKLHCPDGPPELRENYAFTRAELNRIAEALQHERLGFCQEWERIHGPTHEHH